MAVKLHLPREYRLIELASVPDLGQAAVERALAGDEEGTLLWAHRQTAATTRSGKPWLSGEGDLHCALVLRPEEPRALAWQSVLVAAVSLGSVLAEQVSPMTPLHYRWPNDVLLRQGKVAGIQARWQPADDGFSWLVLGINMNVVAVPEPLSFSAAAVNPDGECECDAGELLEGFARHFLRAINRWADDGAAPVLANWRLRVADVGQFVQLQIGGQAIEGVLREVGDDGAVLIATGDGDRRVDLEEFFGSEQ